MENKKVQILEFGFRCNIVQRILFSKNKSKIYINIYMWKYIIHLPKMSNNFLMTSWNAGKKELCSSNLLITLKSNNHTLINWLKKSKLYTN